MGLSGLYWGLAGTVGTQARRGIGALGTPKECRDVGGC